MPLATDLPTNMNRQLGHTEVRTSKPKREIVLVCDGVQGPANMGSIFRLSDAFGVKKIYFSTAVDTGSGRLRKTSRSTFGWVEYQDLADPLAVAKYYKEEGYLLVALEITEDSISLQALEIEGPLCILIGGEMHGIGQQLLNLTDQTVHIDLFGENSSMNVAQATAILLYQLCKS